MVATVRMTSFLSLVTGFLVAFLGLSLVLYGYSCIAGSLHIEDGSTQILPQVQGYDLTYMYRDTAFEQLSGQEAALAYSYESSDQSLDGKTVFVAIQVTQNASVLHRWEDASVNATLLDLRDVQIQDNSPIVARYFAFQDNNTRETRLMRQVVLYWFETATFTINSQTQLKHAEISLINYPGSTQDIKQAEDQLLPIATSISDHWQYTKTLTIVALVIIVMTSALLVIVVAYRLVLERQERQALKQN